MKAHGHNVKNVAIGGTTAKGWAADKYALKNAVDDYPEAEYIWLTIGGNDAFPKMITKQPIEKLMNQLLVDTRIFLDVLFENYPDIKVEQFGYDLINFKTNSVLCTGFGELIFTGYCGLIPSVTCINKNTYKL